MVILSVNTWPAKWIFTLLKNAIRTTALPHLWRSCVVLSGVVNTRRAAVERGSQLCNMRAPAAVAWACDDHRWRRCHHGGCWWCCSLTCCWLPQLTQFHSCLHFRPVAWDLCAVVNSGLTRFTDFTQLDFRCHFLKSRGPDVRPWLHVKLEGACESAYLRQVNFYRRPFFQKTRGHVRTVPGNMTSNLKSVALTVLELLAFNAQTFRGHVTLATPPFLKILRSHIRTVPGNTLVKFEVCIFNRFAAICI